MTTAAKEFWIMTLATGRGGSARRKVYGWTPDAPKKLLREGDYRDALAIRVDGITEVVMSIGRADVMTDNMVYEVKQLREWKHGIMQVLAYSAESGLPPAIALYGDPASVPSKEVQGICKALGASIWWYGPKGWKQHYKNAKADATAQLIRELQRTQQPVTPEELAAGGPSVVCLPRPSPNLQMAQAWSPRVARGPHIVDDLIS